jgi:hypothetical protein
MKKITITYWTATAIVALLMAFSAFAYFTNPMVKQGFVHLGFPDYFRVELAIAKIIGVVLLLTPLNKRIKEWVYAGFTITFVSAFISHVASGDPVQNVVMPLLFLVPLALSYFTYHKMQTAKRPMLV